jgi:L-aspartate oxidase
VLLDMRELRSDAFPNVVAALGRAGFDHRRDLIPVAPAAHYMIGGVLVDADGRSGLAGLLAIGECCCTGMHGANRLASNSLSECFVFGRRAALAAAAAPPLVRLPEAVPWSAPPPALSDRTRAALWEQAGLVRERSGLEELTGDDHPLARLVAESALARKESRGCHQRSDFPRTDPALAGTHVVTEPAEPAIRLTRWT